MAAEHTPGPWEIRESKEGEGVCIYAGKYGIGKVWNLNGNPENEANARLIAAAPKLLAIAKAALAFIDSHVADPDLTEEMVTKYNALRLLEPHDAIAKAEGQSTRRDGPVLREGVA